MSTEQVEALIQRHIQRYPEIDIQDVYKLLHEAVFGPGHGVIKRKNSQEWLDRQIELADSAPDQPLVESIHPEDAVVRLYLHPYKQVNGNFKKLLDMFIDTAKAMDGNLETMANWWGIFQTMTERDRALGQRFNPRTVSLITRARAAEHWPATHHSSSFDRAYKPFYRILTRPLAEKLLSDQKIAFKLV